MFHKSGGKELECCAWSSIPACSINFLIKLGFLREAEPASLSLKWTSCFFNDRKCANFAFDEGFGEPGGDGGISRFGIGGRVKSWINVRDADDCSSTACRVSNSSCIGPSTGPLGSRLKVVSDTTAGWDFGVCWAIKQYKSRLNQFWYEYSLLLFRCVSFSACDALLCCWRVVNGYFNSQLKSAIPGTYFWIKSRFLFKFVLTTAFIIPKTQHDPQIMINGGSKPSKWLL